MLGTVGARAHANAVRSTPAVDALVADAPGEVAVWFNAAIDPAASGLTLLDQGGHTLAQGRGSPGGERDRVAVAAPSLGPGTYAVVWQNVSQGDGHANSDYHTFSVVRPDAPLAIAPTSDTRPNSSGSVTLSITPQDDGRQRIEVAPLDARGQPLADLQRVMLRFRLQQPAAGPTTVDAAPTSGGRYGASTGLLGIVGAYDVDVVLRRRRVDDQTTKFTLQAALPTAPAAPPP